jgi:hypothetical protein
MTNISCIHAVQMDAKEGSDFTRIYKKSSIPQNKMSRQTDRAQKTDRR